MPLSSGRPSPSSSVEPVDAEPGPATRLVHATSDERADGPGALRDLSLALAVGEVATALPELFRIDGTPLSLESSESEAAIVVAFLGNSCPAVKACVESLNVLQTDFAPRAVRVIGVNSNNPHLSPRDSTLEMGQWAEEHHLRFSYLKDPLGRFARRMGVTNTPHFVVLDREQRLRYRGRMFDSRDPEQATTHDLEVAVVCVLSDQSIGMPETQALGCSIVW
jgi:peroxiredoxin